MYMLANIIREEKIQLQRPNTPWNKNGNLLVNAEIPFWMVEKQEKGIFLPDYKGGYYFCPTPEETLEETVNHEVETRNSFLGKTQVIVDGKTFVGKKRGKVLVAENYKPNFAVQGISAASLSLLSILFSWGCDNGDPIPTPTPDPTKYYNITAINQSILSNADIGGNVILNSVSGESGTTYSVKGGEINTLNVEVPGYINAYIVARDSNGNVKYTRDEKGCHPAIILSDTTLYLRLIPNDFDTVLLAKCVGNGSMINGESIGDGTVQNYNKQNINVGVKNHGEEITDRVRDFTKEAIQRINNAAQNQSLGQVINLSYIGDVNDDLSDGCTARVQSVGGGHHEDLNGDIIYKSNIITVPNPSQLRMLFEELTQATTGLRWDAGVDHLPYISIYLPYNWENDAERAIQINNLLPPGFKLSTEKVPGVVIQKHPAGYDPNPTIDNPFSLNPLDKTHRLPRTYIIKQAPRQRKEYKRK